MAPRGDEKLCGDSIESNSEVGRKNEREKYKKKIRVKSDKNKNQIVKL